MKILGIVGSLRKHSYNRGLLQAALEVLPSGSELEIIGLEGIPLYSQDIENNMPPAVVQMKAKIRAADAILIATPEYNYSMPGVLKNAIDWCSRPYGDSAWDGKKVALMGASPAELGTSRAQYHLRQVFVYFNAKILNRPEFMLGKAHEKFDANGKLIDPKTKEKLKEFLVAFVKL